MSNVSPRRPRPSPPGESIVTALTGGVLTFVGMLSFLIYLEYGYTLLLAFPPSCLVALLILLARLKRRDYEIYLAMFPPEPEPEPQPEPDPILTPVTVQSNGLGQIMTYAGFNLPLSDWQRLARVFLKSKKLTRDNVAAANIKHDTFSHLSKVYPTIRTKLIKAEWFDREGELTDVGRAHFEQFLEPGKVHQSPPPTPQLQPIVANLQETTTTTTGQGGRK